MFAVFVLRTYTRRMCVSRYVYILCIVRTMRHIIQSVMLRITANANRKCFRRESKRNDFRLSLRADVADSNVDVCLFVCVSLLALATSFHFAPVHMSHAEQRQ